MEEKEVVVQLDIAELARIVRDAVDQEGGIDAMIDAFRHQWSLVWSVGGVCYTKGFDSQRECADRVSELHVHEEVSLLYVLKNGVPRKSIKIEVKARFR